MTRRIDCPEVSSYNDTKTRAVPESEKGRIYISVTYLGGILVLCVRNTQIYQTKNFVLFMRLSRRLLHRSTGVFGHLTDSNQTNTVL